MQQGYSEVVQAAREYYNSEDADNFYYHIWGGEDIHIGLYEQAGEDIATASHRTVQQMAALLPALNPDTRVLDIGAGYGGAARYLAKTYGCPVTALNLSETENERNRAMNRDAGLDHLIEVLDASFEDIPSEDSSVDVVWSQDAILHSGHRERVIVEVARVLTSGGDFIFTDPMQTDDCPEGVLQPVLDRIHLDSLGSLRFYRQAAERCGLRLVTIVDHSEQLPRHYGRVRQVLNARQSELTNNVSKAYIERMLTGLSHWVEAGEKGYLVWGILHFKKES